MESIRLFLRKCVDSADTNGIVDMNVIEHQYAEFGDNLFNLNLEDALFVSVVRIMASCENDIHVSDVYGMWNACREFVNNGYMTATMAQLEVAYAINPREFAKCIRNKEDYIDVVENNNEYKHLFCLFEIMKITFRLSMYINTHSNVDPNDVVFEYKEPPKYGLYDE